MTRLAQKLARIRAGKHTRQDFILADAKDPDMGPSMSWFGQVREADGSVRLRSRDEFLDRIKAILAQDIVDIMLTSVGNLERLQEDGAFSGSLVKPAIRANDTTDIWVMRGGAYAQHPSRPFRSASLHHARKLTDLGLYSITFNNDLDADYASLEAFAEFRDDAEANGFNYFLEVFNPNASKTLTAETTPAFVNDAISRCLAGLTRAERPQFLKMAYNGPKALAELASNDPTLIVGILGGSAGTTRDCFEMLAQVQKYGAHVALFGRKINQADDQLAMVQMMRRVLDGEVSSAEGVKAYHGELQKAGVKPTRDLAADSEITEAVLKQG